MAAPVQPLRPSQLAEACRALAAAFHEDPLSRFFFPQEETRRRWLPRLHEAGLRQVLPEGHVYAVQDEGIAGVIGLVPPGRYPLPAWRTLRLLLGIALRFPSGGLSLRRAVQGMLLTRRVEGIHPREPHWYVSVLGVEPRQQGKGLGRALLDPALARADGQRLPVYLETSNERNLSFYRHFGFEVVEEIETPGGGPPLWAMLRPPVT